MHCSLIRAQPLDSEISAPSRRLACLLLPTNLLGVGEIFFLGSLARLPGPPCIYCGGLKGENWGPQDSKSPRRDTADEGLEVRRLYLETALDYLQLCDQHCPLVAACCQGSLSSVTQSCPTLRPHDHSRPGLPVHHQLLEFTQTHVRGVGDAIQPSHPLSSPSPPAPNPS